MGFHVQRAGVWRLAALLAAIALTINGAPVNAANDLPQRLPAITVETKIVAGCTVNISVADEPGITHDYTVDAGGNVHFSISDTAGRQKQEWSVALAGKSAAEARAALVQSLSAYFKNPEVRIVIVKLPVVHVDISGEVQRQGIYLLPQHTRVSDLLTASVTGPLADLTNVLVRRSAARPAASGPRTFNVDLTSAPSTEDDDPVLEDGDKVYFRKLEAAPVAAILQVVRVVG